MTFRRYTAALAVAAALTPGIAAGVSPEEVAEVFRRGCLDQLPDFSGSAAEFERLGFIASDGMLRFDAAGGKMLAGVNGPTNDPVSTCVLNANLPPTAAIAPPVASAIAELTENHFNHDGVDKNGVHAETFNWRADETLVSVTLVSDVMGMYSLTVLVGTAPK